jgi:hypothetical protein
MSPRLAIVLGLLCAAVGVVIILAGVGVLPLAPAPDVQRSPWVVVCAGLMFVFVGAALIVGFAVAGGSGPDGDLPAGTPFGVRLLQYLLGLGIVGSLTAIFTWIAFGPGERHFSSTVVLPFMTRGVASGETSGRVVFGIAAVLIWLFLVTFGFVGARRLFRDARK